MPHLPGNRRFVGLLYVSSGGPLYPQCPAWRARKTLISVCFFGGPICRGLLAVPVAHRDTSPRVRGLYRGFADLSLRVDEHGRDLCEQGRWLLDKAA